MLEGHLRRIEGAHLGSEIILEPRLSGRRQKRQRLGQRAGLLAQITEENEVPDNADLEIGRFDVTAGVVEIEQAGDLSIQLLAQIGGGRCDGVVNPNALARVARGFGQGDCGRRRAEVGAQGDDGDQPATPP